MANKVPGALRGVTFTAHTPTNSFFSTDCATSIVGINAHTAAKLINLFFIIVVFDVFFTAKRDTCKHPRSKDAVAIIQKLERQSPPLTAIFPCLARERRQSKPPIPSQPSMDCAIRYPCFPGDHT